MDKPEAVQEVLPNDAAQTVSVAETTETQESGLQNVTNSKETIDNNVSPGDDPTVTSENGAHPESSEEKPGNAVAPGNESAPPPENGAGLVVTVCGTTEAREEVCVTVCGEEGEREGEKKRSETLPNGKPSSASEYFYLLFHCPVVLMFVFCSVSTATSAQLFVLVHSLWETVTVRIRRSVSLT